MKPGSRFSLPSRQPGERKLMEQNRLAPKGSPSSLIPAENRALPQAPGPVPPDGTRQEGSSSDASMARPLRTALRRSRRPVLSVGFVLLVLASWQLSSTLRWVNPLYTSSPKGIAVEAYNFLPTHDGLLDMRVSGEEFILGFILAIIAGVALGLLMGTFPIFEELTGLSLNLFYSMPLIALAPLLVLWTGIGLMSKVAVVFLAALFPIMLSTLTGVRQVDKTLINVARSFNAKPLQIWRAVVLPAAVPSIITGIRLGMVAGLIGVIVGEFISSSAGIGYLVVLAGNDFNTTLMFVGLLVIVVVAGILTALLRLAERHFSDWRTE
jgi:ABC-type nitrate/sulfonate/bicarbonate transport system permease component